MREGRGAAWVLAWSVVATLLVSTSACSGPGLPVPPPERVPTDAATRNGLELPDAVFDAATSNDDEDADAPTHEAAAPPIGKPGDPPSGAIGSH